VWPLESASPLLDSAAREVLAPLKVPVPRLGTTRASSGLPRRPTPPSLHYRCRPVAPPPPPTPGMQPASLLPCSTCNCRVLRASHTRAGAARGGGAPRPITYFRRRFRNGLLSLDIFIIGDIYSRTGKD
jgi:hypothetical protein